MFHQVLSTSTVSNVNIDWYVPKSVLLFNRKNPSKNEGISVAVLFQTPTTPSRPCIIAGALVY